MEESTALKTFRLSCKELFDYSGLKTFLPVMVPIVHAEASVDEHLIQEYSTLELFALRFIHAGANSIDDLERLMGLSRTTLEKIVENERDVYGHIDSDFKLTQGGMMTLENNSDIHGQLKEDTLNYDVKKELYIEASTGTALRYDYRPSSNMRYLNLFDTPYTKSSTNILIFSLPSMKTVEVTERVKKAILKGLYQKQMDIFNDGDTIDAVNSIVTVDQQYAWGYFAQFEADDSEMVVIKGRSYDPSAHKMMPSYLPSCISERLSESISAAEDDKYLVMDESNFEYLKDFGKTHKGISAIDIDQEIAYENEIRSAAWK